MLQTLENKAKQTARSVALSLAGALTMAVGVAFLTAAAWIYLSVVTNILIAASVIGSAYLGLGLILLACSTSRSAEMQTNSSNAAQHHAVETPAPEMPPIMQAFVYGMQAGAHAKSK